jgi:hypothetical protein
VHVFDVVGKIAASAAARGIDLEAALELEGAVAVYVEA